MVKRETDLGAFARDIMRLPERVQRALALLMRLYLERQVTPSSEIDAEIERVEEAIDNRRFDEIDAPGILPH